MMMRQFLLGIVISTIFGVTQISAATIRTKNFIVTAPNVKLAEEFGELAEKYRKEKALYWLGYEMKQWQTPCPLQIIIDQSGTFGATEFNFQAHPLTQSMRISGKYDRLKDSVLPHEITHTVFAYHFKRPVPRWADEGGSVYSEDEQERVRHDQICRQILNTGHGMTLNRLFRLITRR